MDSVRQRPMLAHSISVAALGMEKRTYSSFENFFRLKCANNYQLVKEKFADISIIDMDGYKAEEVLQNHKAEYPNRPIILTSLRDINSDDEIFLRKPIKIAALSVALNTAEKRIQAASSSTENNTVNSEPPVLSNKVAVDKSWNMVLKPKVRTPNSENNKWSSRSLDSLVAVSDSGLHLLPEEYKNEAITTRLLRKLQYDPKNMLQGYFKQAYDTALVSRCNVRLEGPWRPITILFKQHRVLVDSNFRHIFALSAMTFEPNEISITLIREDENKAINDGGVTQSIEQFFWKLSLRTSRGKVPIGTDLTVPVLLKQWPNFTRTSITPHALRIAALWAKQPTSLLKTAEILNISISFVFAFYSSALPLNLVTQLVDTETAIDQEENIGRHAYRKLFGSLLSKLNSKKNVDVG